MADLITRNELKIARGENTAETENDALYDLVIGQATDAIRAYTGRDFGTDPITEMRAFEYDGTGILDIPDASTVTSVVLSEGAGLDWAVPAEQWRAQPYGSPVISWLELPTGHYGASPAMGFTRNLDVYAAEGSLRPLPSLVKVTATWGWTTVPPAVKRAAIWTAVSFAESPEPYISKAIEGYSVAIGPAPNTALPDRALRLLDPYIRISV